MSRPAVGPFAVAGLASIGAGCIHLTAIASHRDDPASALTFAALAAAQLAWGGIAIPARQRAVAVVGLLLAALAVGGWLLAKTSGIGFVTGLDAVEPLQAADLIAAALSMATMIVLGRALLAGGSRSPATAGLAAAAIAVGALTVFGMANTRGHQHVHADQGPIGHAHGGGAVLAGGWDPQAPIDLSGGAGVTPGEQDRAERFLDRALRTAPRYADVAAARAAGFRPIGDAGSGIEHLVRWPSVVDRDVADPTRPESLVYEVGPDGQRTLVALRYLLRPGETAADAPVLGGALTPWEPVEDLCLRTDPDGGEEVAGLAEADGACPPPTAPAGRLLGLHVWTVPHACGPFSSVEAPDARAGDSPACGAGEHGG